MPGILNRLSYGNETNSNQDGKTFVIPEVNVDALEGRVCYFSLSGDQALKAYEENALSSIKNPKKKRARLKAEVTKRLSFAIFMFDKVVMHCSDPLRSEVILAILEEHRQWIEDGRILFIFSHHIRDIKQDYRNYINLKKTEYSEEDNAQKEADSLNQDHMTEDYYQRVIDILTASKAMVRKSIDPRCSFSNLVEADLERASESVIVEADSHLTQIPLFKLSLYQLLHAKQLSKDGRNGTPVFPEDIIDGDGGVTESIEECLEQGTPIARSAIVDLIRKGLKEKGRKPTQLQKRVLKAITLRMDILYCKMNCGKQLILEFHPIYESNSIYHAELFRQYICSVTGSDTNSELTDDMISTMMTQPNLHDLRFGYLACMADTIERMNIFSEQTILLRDTFSDIMERNGIPMNS